MSSKKLRNVPDGTLITYPDGSYKATGLVGMVIHARRTFGVDDSRTKRLEREYKRRELKALPKPKTKRELEAHKRDLAREGKRAARAKQMLSGEAKLLAMHVGSGGVFRPLTPKQMRRLPGKLRKRVERRARAIARANRARAESGTTNGSGWTDCGGGVRPCTDKQSCLVRSQEHRGQITDDDHKAGGLHDQRQG